MNQRSNDYFVKINPQFLFNTQGIFKSYFTPWVYLYLKLEKNMLISKQIHNEFKINQKDLVEFFMVDRATIYRAIKELMNFGVLSKSGSKYRIFDEQSIINQKSRLYQENLVNLIDSSDTDTDEELPETEQTKVTSLDKLPEYIQIFQNEFLKLRIDVLESEDILKDYSRTVIKIIEIYYYLIACNKLCLLPGIDKLESDETQTSISRNLKHDNRFTNMMLGVLSKINYIEQYENGGIVTIKKKITGYFSSDVNTDRALRVTSFENRMGTEQPVEEVNTVNCRNGYEVASEDTFDFVSSFSGNQDNHKDTNKEVKANESEDRVAEEVTNQERLGYLFDMSKGEVEIFIDKAIERNIPEEEVEIWLQNNRAA
ncbi:MAG: hypothetical protein JSS63_09860 [Bacteroidetes bacterium]|nr:hypothetical protein [Bacteroidota bacterium]